MAAQTLTGLASMARVNLLPPEIAEKNKVRRSQVAMLGTGLAAVAVVCGMYVTQTARVSAAKDDLTQAQSRTTSLQAQVRSLSNVSEVYAQRQAAERTLSTAMAKEIRWSRFLNDLSLTIPGNVWLSSLSVKANVDPGGTTALTPTTAAGSTSALVDPGIGTVQFQGLAFDYDDVAAWLESLAKQRGYANPFLTKAALLDEKVPSDPIEFDSSVNLTSAALSNRYTKRAGG